MIFQHTPNHSTRIYYQLLNSGNFDCITEEKDIIVTYKMLDDTENLIVLHQSNRAKLTEKQVHKFIELLVDAILKPDQESDIYNEEYLLISLACSEDTPSMRLDVTPNVDMELLNKLTIRGNSK